MVIDQTGDREYKKKYIYSVIANKLFNSSSSVAKVEARY
jgi:hypothetical protein